MTKRKALCVAIDDYGHPANNLNNCIADVEAFEQLLKSRYNFDEVKSLRDAQATIKNVEEGLDWLLSYPQPDDRLVFQFSGHGYQSPTDGVREEVLVLRDGFFQDDRLSQRTQHLPPGIFTAVLDSCFSGGMEKILILTDTGLEVGRPKRWTPIDAKQLQKEQTILEKSPKIKLKPFCAEPASTPAALAKDFGFPVLAGGAGAPAAALIPAPASDEGGQIQMKGLLLSACVENETASAKTSQTNGLSAFTYGLVEALKEVGSRVATAELMAAVQRRLKAMGFRQTPLMKAPPDPTDLGERSFLLLESVSRPKREESSEPNIERLLELIYNVLREDKAMSMTAPSMTAPQAGDEKFFGAIISAVTAVAPHVLPIVIDALRKDYQPGAAYGGMTQPTKDYQPGLAQPTTAMQPTAGGGGGGDEKFFGAIVSAVSAVAPHVLPIVLNALRKDYQPGMAQPTSAAAIH